MLRQSPQPMLKFLRVLPGFSRGRRDERDEITPSKLQTLGLSPDTPIVELEKLIRDIAALSRPSQSDAIEIAQKSPIPKYVSATANWATVASFLLQLATLLR
jgi:hypothetical protein